MTLQNEFSDIRFLLWDNDGILVDTEPFYYEAGRRVLADNGVELTHEHFKEHSLLLGQSVFDVARELGVPEPKCIAMRDRRDALYADLVRTEDIFVPGVEAVVAQLADHFRMCIVSSSLKLNFHDIHARTGALLSHFEFQLLSGDYPRSKPHPDPWLTAASRLGAPPAQCLVIEDSPRGIQAAKAAGMGVVAVESHFFNEAELRPHMDKSDHCIARIHDLPQLLLTV